MSDTRTVLPLEWGDSIYLAKRKDCDGNPYLALERRHGPAMFSLEKDEIKSLISLLQNFEAMSYAS